VAATGTFMATLDSGLVNVALPTIAQDFGAALPAAQWVITGYMLAISCLLPLCGRAGDILGRRSVYRLGFLIFALASALGGAAPSLGMLVASRVLQGMGASLLMANSSAVILEAFPGVEKGRALGFVGLVVAVGTLSGPSLGGIIMHATGWRFLFYLTVPVGLAGMFLARLLPASARQGPRPSFDLPGAGLFALGLTGLLLALTHGRDWGLASPRLAASLGLGLLAWLLFWLRERSVPEPMLDMKLLSHWPFLSGNLASMLSFMALFSNAILLPFYLQNQRGMPTSRVGLIMAAMPLAVGFTAPFSGWFSERVNQALLASGGLTLSCTGLLLQSGLTLSTPLWRVLLGQAVIGLGIGLFQSPNNNSVLSSAPRDKAGQAGGIMALVRNLGVVCGVSLAVAAFELFRGGDQADPAAFFGGFSAALRLGALLALCGAVLSFRRRGHFRT
jgi:EmrB/QacA subfamily drug resistance transporter